MFRIFVSTNFPDDLYSHNIFIFVAAPANARRRNLARKTGLPCAYVYVYLRAGRMVMDWKQGGKWTVCMVRVYVREWSRLMNKRNERTKRKKKKKKKWCRDARCGWTIWILRKWLPWGSLARGCVRPYWFSRSSSMTISLSRSSGCSPRPFSGGTAGCTGFAISEATFHWFDDGGTDGKWSLRYTERKGKKRKEKRRRRRRRRKERNDILSNDTQVAGHYFPMVDPRPVASRTRLEKLPINRGTMETRVCDHDSTTNDGTDWFASNSAKFETVSLFHVPLSFPCFVNDVWMEIVRRDWRWVSWLINYFTNYRDRRY